MAQLKSNIDRAKKAQLTMKLAIIATVLTMFSSILTIYILDARFTIDPSSIILYSAIIGIIGLLFLAIFIVNIVFFIMWFRRAYYNLHQIYRKGLRYSEGWAAGAWFIPFFNLWGPYQIATDLFSKTEKVLVDRNLTETKSSRNSIKGWWWGLWITSNIISNVGDNLTRNSLDGSGEVISIIASLISIAAGIMCLKMIKEYHSMEVLLPQVLKNQSYETDMDTELLDSNI